MPGRLFNTLACLTCFASHYPHELSPGDRHYPHRRICGSVNLPKPHQADWRWSYRVSPGWHPPRLLPRHCPIHKGVNKGAREQGVSKGYNGWKVTLCLKNTYTDLWHRSCTRDLCGIGEWDMLWIGIIIGIFLGANFGIFIITMCAAANMGDQLSKASR